MLTSRTKKRVVNVVNVRNEIMHNLSIPWYCNLGHLRCTVRHLPGAVLAYFMAEVPQGMVAWHRQNASACTSYLAMTRQHGVPPFVAWGDLFAAMLEAIKQLYTLMKHVNALTIGYCRSAGRLISCDLHQLHYAHAALCTRSRPCSNVVCDIVGQMPRHSTCHIYTFCWQQRLQVVPRIIIMMISSVAGQVFVRLYFSWQLTLSHGLAYSSALLRIARS